MVQGIFDARKEFGYHAPRPSLQGVLSLQGCRWRVPLVCSDCPKAVGGGIPGNHQRQLCRLRLTLLSASPLQVFLIIHYAPLVNSLAEVILNGDLSVFSSKVEHDIQKSSVSEGLVSSSSFCAASLQAASSRGQAKSPAHVYRGPKECGV